MKIINAAASTMAATMIIAGSMLLVNSQSLAQETAEALKEQIVGSWKLVAYRSQREGGQEWRQTLGANPKGYAIFTRDGRYMHLLVADNRTPPTNDAERAALLESMTAWSGKYEVIDKGELHITVDTSWAEAHRGTRREQVRLVSMEGDRMVLRTPLQVGARAVTRGVERPHRSMTEFVFEREK